MSKAWCPWCGVELGAEPKEIGASGRCPGCGGKVSEATALSAPPAAAGGTTGADPLPPPAPPGAAPLPVGRADPTPLSLLGGASVVLAGAAVLAVLAWFVGRPALERLPRASPSPSPPAASSPPPEPSP